MKGKYVWNIKKNSFNIDFFWWWGQSPKTWLGVFGKGRVKHKNNNNKKQKHTNKLKIYSKDLHMQIKLFHCQLKFNPEDIPHLHNKWVSFAFF